MADDRIELADFIRVLRSQLQAAGEEGAGQELRFDVQKLELEIQTEIECDASVSGRFKVWVANLGASTSEKDRVTQTIRLSLLPVGADGNSSRLGRRASRES